MASAVPVSLLIVGDEKPVLAGNHPPEALLLQQQVAYRKALGSRNRPLRERQEGRPEETV